MITGETPVPYTHTGKTPDPRAWSKRASAAEMNFLRLCPLHGGGSLARLARRPWAALEC